METPSFKIYSPKFGYVDPKPDNGKISMNQIKQAQVVGPYKTDLKPQYLNYSQVPEEYERIRELLDNSSQA